MHNLFGGKWTGRGDSDLGAGYGGSGWCHTNGKGTYDSWIRRGKGGAKFYVLARKDWKDIPFDAESNNENPKDDYGNSLIALLVDKKTGELLNATLRCNHAGIRSGSADNQYQTYGELSQLAGFNIKDAIMEDLSGSTGQLKIKEVSLDKAKFALGDRVSLTVTGYGDFTATAIQKNGNGMLFVFDQVVKYGKMANINAHLDKILHSIADTDFLSRITVESFRLLTASEVFSGCDEPTEWTFLTDFGVEDEGSQIPYFISEDNRGIATDEDRGWWTASTTEDEEHYVVVKDDGSGNIYPDKKLRGIRPVFTVV